MYPLVSIIVPCFCQVQYLDDALESVLAQTYQNWECIIVNDGSPDHTESVATRWCKKDERFKYLPKENGGVSSARNAGIIVASGEFILPLDADDTIHPQYLELAAECFSRNEELILVYCKAAKFGMENIAWELESYNFKNLLINNHIFCSAIYRKASWARVGGYDEKFKKGYEDWDFWIKILDEKSLVIQLPTVLFYYRIKESSRTKDMRLEDHEEEKWQVYLNNWQKYRENFTSPITVIYHNHALQAQITDLNLQVKQLLSSYSYRFGNLLLKPISYLKTFFA